MTAEPSPLPERVVAGHELAVASPLAGAIADRARILRFSPDDGRCVVVLELDGAEGDWPDDWALAGSALLYPVIVPDQGWTAHGDEFRRGPLRATFAGAEVTVSGRVRLALRDLLFAPAAQGHLGAGPIRGVDGVAIAVLGRAELGAAAAYLSRFVGLREVALPERFSDALDELAFGPILTAVERSVVRGLRRIQCSEHPFGSGTPVHLAGPADLEPLAAAVALTEADITLSCAYDEVVEAFAVAHPSLEVLRLGAAQPYALRADDQEELSQRAASMLAGLPRLRSLICKCRWSSVEAFERLGDCRSLTYLELAATPGGPAAMATIARLTKLRELRCPDLAVDVGDQRASRSAISESRGVRVGCSS